MTIGFPKSPKSTRVKLTQKQMGEISLAVDTELKERSHGLCEMCEKALATERAHLTGRPHLKHKTTVTDLIHLCSKCHDWLDETPEGIRSRNFIVTVISKVLQKS
ncbi:hypothetical protein [Paenibacillus antarcticus]|uniref:HNH domain-containing protein n=1 Tax=Paenibacillus antarcticus TaxID=253703 RepID=A0A168R258_9BACL|nr:hypothetical protein [Paenibacillus antarcticus]OAB48491.1 hypothetical protein PBAT_02335 [Paenibacillus antarcticus]